jgi:hypothetical protein
MKNIYLFLFFFLAIGHLQAQKRFTISGYFKAEGEDLVGASLYVQDDPSKIAQTNNYGFYSLTLAEGEYSLVASYFGYTDQVVKINLRRDTSINFNLSSGVEMDQVEVTAEGGNDNVQSTKMGTVEISVELAKKLPALLGEVDILKTIQLLPGVISAGEGNAGFYVRGGSVDQNLVLLDEAVVYNTGHLLGFFSVFNSDAIKNATLIKGGMPANYGGRISSVLDIQMKEGNDERFGVEGGIGLVASRLTLQGPMVKDKASFILSGRRTYVFDLAQPFLKGTNFEGTNYYFYDFNAKANWRISQRDRLFLSGYFGRDVLELRNPQRNLNVDMPWGNATATLRWNHLFSDRLFMNAMLIFNDYDFAVGGKQSQFSFKLQSGVTDWGTKVSFDYYHDTKHQFKFGFDHTYHIFTPNIAQAFSGDEAFIISPEKRRSHESGIYALDEWRVSNRLSLNLGLRGSMFNPVGPYTSKLDSTRTYGTGERITTYWGIEPRVSGRYLLTEVASLKGGITLGRQYIHLVSNSATTLPTDLWVPSSEIVKPQWGLQYALGYFHNFKNNEYEASVEVYYKDLYNQLDYSEDFTQTPDTDLEDQFIRGRGYAYGAEFFVRKNRGKLTGWVAYTYSRAMRVFEDIKGEVFPARFDKPHNISVVANYDLNDRWNFGATFVYGSGTPYTPIKSMYLINFTPVIEYGLRNSARLPDYHRLDLSASFRLDNPKKKKRFESTLVLSAYNVYNRRNVFFTYVVPETDARTGELALNAYKVSLFPIIPSLTWNFTWK